MTFLEQIQAHTGGLVRLKTQLYWYGGPGYDNNPGRICLILDATTAARRSAAARTAAAHVRSSTTLLLIDGSPQWIWIAEADVEIKLEHTTTHTHACIQAGGIKSTKATTQFGKQQRLCRLRQASKGEATLAW